MNVLALDLSTSTGWALFSDGDLKCHGKIVRKVEGTEKSTEYPINYLEMAEDIGFDVLRLVLKYDPKYVVIEETNKGKNRFHQKQLEYIHFSVASKLRGHVVIRYLDTSRWHYILGIKISNDQRSYNKEINNMRNEKREEISRQIYLSFEQEIKRKVESCRLKREANKIVKEYDKKIKKLVGKEMGKLRTKINGRMVTKVDNKNLSVAFVNEQFNLDFKKSDNDIADAICVGAAFIKNNYITSLKA